jgi:hypothetical protein
MRLSRSSIDDTIGQNLNALIAPSKAGFDPSSTSHRTPSSFSRQISPQSCRDFKEKVLFPSWEARSNVLFYCGLVAASPDPEDPEATLREVESQRDRERVVDERLDPYSGRFFPREARTERLASLVRQESQVDEIVKSRTWGIVQQRCGESSESWESAFEQWRVARKAKNA